MNNLTKTNSLVADLGVMPEAVSCTTDCAIFEFSSTKVKAVITLDGATAELHCKGVKYQGYSGSRIFVLTTLGFDLRNMLNAIDLLAGDAGTVARHMGNMSALLSAIVGYEVTLSNIPPLLYTSHSTDAVSMLSDLAEDLVNFKKYTTDIQHSLKSAGLYGQNLETALVMLWRYYRFCCKHFTYEQRNKGETLIEITAIPYNNDREFMMARWLNEHKSYWYGSRGFFFDRLYETRLVW